MSRFCTIAAATLTLVSLGCATPIEHHPWHAVSSANFEILSPMREAEVVGLATDLERFRALIFTLMKPPRSESAVPTSITAFDRQFDLNQFSGDPRIAGSFSAGLRSNHILLSRTGLPGGAEEIVFHEYIHFILRNGAPARFPLWYDEGFAEFLSTARVREDKMAIGAVPRLRAPTLRSGIWIPIDRILTTTSLDGLRNHEIAAFYAQSWALVHELSLGRPDDDVTMNSEMNAYLEYIEAGAGTAAAFERAFGESPERMDARLQEKVWSGSWIVRGLPIEALRYDEAAPVVRRARADEVAVRLGELRLLRGPSGSRKAESHFRRALETNPKNDRAEAGLGMALGLQHRWDEAATHLRRSVDLAPEDALNVLSFAVLMNQRALAEPNRAARRKELARARDLFARSLSLDPSIPETWLRLGRTHLESGESPALAIGPLERALALLPSHPAIVDTLAEAYVATDRIEDARQLLNRASGILHGDQPGSAPDERIEAIREKIGTRDEANTEESDSPPNAPRLSLSASPSPRPSRR